MEAEIPALKEPHRVDLRLLVGVAVRLQQTISSRAEHFAMTALLEQVATDRQVARGPVVRIHPMEDSATPVPVEGVSEMAPAPDQAAGPETGSRGASPRFRPE